MADYILTIIEQVGLMLAELARLKSGEKPAGISVLCLRETGLPLAVVKHSSPETILQLLKTGGGTQYARAVLLPNYLYKMLTSATPPAKSGRRSLVVPRQRRCFSTALISFHQKNKQSIDQSLMR